VTANRLPSIQSYRSNAYQHLHPSMMMMNNSSTISRGRSLTPPSLKPSARLSSMHHMRSEDFYPPYPPSYYMDPAYYRPYDDPYVMQRLPPFPSSLISASSTSSRSYGHMYASSNFNRYPPGVYHRRSRSRSRSRSRRRYETRPVSSN
jgi:hypothetical protein